MIRGEPWFVGRDVCEVLGYSNVNDAMFKHCKGIAKRYPLETAGGKQEVRIINEPDLYRLIIRSNLPAAEQFEKWVVEEVLPAIRKTGKYSVSKTEQLESTAARNALTEQWREHGADKFYHYVNLTKAEYKHLFGNRDLKKENMTKQERAVLMVFESVEYLKLIQNQELNGYQDLSASLEITAKQLPLFTVSCIGGNA